MNVVFTLCSINHFAKALSLKSSIQTHCPGIKFFIGLVDSIDDEIIPKKIQESIVRIEDIGIPFFRELCIKYTATELNSALKPYLAEYLFKVNPHIDNIIYLDSDILVFNSLNIIFSQLDTYDIVITPHKLSSTDDIYFPNDRTFLRSGIFNAGFFAVKRGIHSTLFIEWWKGKLRNECFNDISRGMFGDQLWLNYVPVFFDNVLILKHLGVNVAYWNLHERKIDIVEGKYLINNEVPLIFFHFSGAAYNCFGTGCLSDHQDRYTFVNRPDVIPVFKFYIDQLTRNSFLKYNSYYTISSRTKDKTGIIKPLMEFYKKVLKRLLYNK